MGKRSPILGYNHNVRYRGLVFHVQTEDSGVATPHLFTHLFHHGVIVSTRKLVYDAGSAEESIKSLMQAQHKAVLKDLRRGHFDDKIDSYLGGTPGLLPRGVAEEVDRAGEVEVVPSRGIVEDIAMGAPTEQVLPVMLDELSAPVLILETTPPPGPPPAPPRNNTPPPIPRLPTSERLSAQLAARGPVPVDTTLKTEAPAFASTTMAAASSGELDLAPEIEIQLELDDNDEAVSISRRATRDTEMNVLPDETRPTLGFDDYTRPTLGMVNEEARRAASISDGIPGAIRPSSPALPPPPPADSRRLDNRPSTINAATLPPARPIARPPARPALSQPQVVSRAATSDDRSRRESDPVEVYSPAPPSAELPPGERPGQYAQHKKVSTKIPIEGLRDVASHAPHASKEPAKADRSGGVAIPAGLGRPVRSGTSPSPNRPHSMTPSAGSPALGAPREGQTNGRLTEPLRSRTPTPTRIAPPSPVPGRAPTGGSSGVVMTRPAVIVGAPAKPATTIPRIRKAREDEGRGFGQGLISEKSLDEVILAYLSEDADEK